MKQKLKLQLLNIVSKVHFKISRTYLSDCEEDPIVYLEDCSHNGTYVNKTLVGSGKRVVLENNDVISISIPGFTAYTFMTTKALDGSGLPSVLKHKYAISRTLGTGACGTVKLIFSKIGCKKYAMKMITKKSQASNGGKHPLNDPEKIMNEVRILKALKHPCIIRMEEIVDTPSTVYIILELMEGGELFERIRSKQRLSEKCAKLIFYQVILAVHYLHESGITHRDLKPENILLASDDDVTLVKVSDFGLSKLLDSETMMKTFCGTPMYVAPEILLTGGKGAYTKQVDVWSLGVILYCCLSGRVPFNMHHSKISLQDQIVRGMYNFPPVFDHISENAKDLIRSMLTVNPGKRITISKVLLHPWLRDREMRETVNSLIREAHDENSSPTSRIRYGQ
ncbi:ovarian-specific serine/threonine-protein kinase Lok isoform X2 [Cephus cinctus]|nr:ovarian-specific serine/threonine-protein kinase Lok isoform X2 [Cephus cinctus]